MDDDPVTAVKNAGLYTSFICSEVRSSMRFDAVVFRNIEILGHLGMQKDLSAALTLPASSSALRTAAATMMAVPCWSS